MKKILFAFDEVMEKKLVHIEQEYQCTRSEAIRKAIDLHLSLSEIMGHAAIIGKRMNKTPLQAIDDVIINYYVPHKDFPISDEDYEFVKKHAPHVTTKTHAINYLKSSQLTFMRRMVARPKVGGSYDGVDLDPEEVEEQVTSILHPHFPQESDKKRNSRLGTTDLSELHAKLNKITDDNA